jgi:hypothetical protein
MTCPLVRPVAYPTGAYQWHESMVMISTGRTKYWQEMSPNSTPNHKLNMHSPSYNWRQTPAVRSRHVTTWCTDKHTINNNHFLIYESENRLCGCFPFLSPASLGTKLSPEVYTRTFNKWLCTQLSKAWMLCSTEIHTSDIPRIPSWLSPQATASHQVSQNSLHDHVLSGLH